MRPHVLLLLILALTSVAAFGAEKEAVKAGSRADEAMIDLAKFAPQLLIEQRYKTPRNLAKRPIYPKNARCFLRQGVAERLLVAQAWLDANAVKGTRLKIWDAWRPAWAQKLLWHVLPNKEYLGDPQNGGSLHTWGTCVDATLVDASGHELKMPTDFDVIGPDSRTYYAGKDHEVARNVRWLQQAMSKAGFLVVYDEWWHFVARDWPAYAAVDMSLTDETVAAQ
jgi:D-alanyl-D-alanine dipeptidase